MKRYLIYDIDKHQSSPMFTDELQQSDISDCDNCLSVIVDFRLELRYFNKEWKPINVRKPLPKEFIIDVTERGKGW